MSFSPKILQLSEWVAELSKLLKTGWTFIYLTSSPLSSADPRSTLSRLSLKWKKPNLVKQTSSITAVNLENWENVWKFVIFQVFLKSLLIVTGIRIFHLTAQFSQKRELSILSFSNEGILGVETRHSLKSNQKGKKFQSENILSLWPLWLSTLLSLWYHCCETPLSWSWLSMMIIIIIVISLL